MHSFRKFGNKRSTQLNFVCNRMGVPFLKVIARKAPQVLNILDRFHIMRKFDEIRRSQVKQFKEDNQQNILECSHRLLLKHPENLAEKQAVWMSELLKLNLAFIKEYLMREDFKKFWDYQCPDAAEKFLDNWGRSGCCR